jgi:hypothetical protein
MTTANSNTTQVLPDQSVPIIDRYRRWTAPWWRFMKPLLESVNRNSSNISAVSADLTTAQAAITTEATVRAAADGALASQITTIEAAYQLADTSLQAQITNEATARAAEDGVIATQISTVKTTVGENTTSIEQLTTSVDGYAGKWSLSLNTNGRVTGAITLSGTSSQSELAFLADKFIIVHPTDDATTVQAFVVGLVDGTSTVGINGNLIVDDTIVARHIAAGAIGAEEIAAESISADKLDVTSLSAIAADVGEVTAGVMRSADGLMIIDLDNKSITMSV